MGLYRTAIVQGLSIVHGRGARRQIRPAFWVFILVTLKDTHTMWDGWVGVCICARVFVRYIKSCERRPVDPLWVDVGFLVFNH